MILYGSHGSPALWDYLSLAFFHFFLLLVSQLLFLQVANTK